MDSLESMPGLLKSLQIRVLACRYDNPIPTQFLAPIDCFKIPAQMGDGELYGEPPFYLSWSIF